MLEDRLGGFDRNAVLGLVAVLNAEVEIEEVDVEIRPDQLVLDQLPDDPGHLVAVEFDNRVGDLDLGHAYLVFREGAQAKGRAGIRRAL